MESLFAIGVGAYALTTLGFLAALWRAPMIGRIARWALIGTIGFWLVLLGMWCMDTSHRGGVRLWLGTSAILLNWIYLFLSRRQPIEALGSVTSALGTLLTLMAVLSHRASPVFEGAAADWLLRIHIGTAFVGVTAFGFASAVSVGYLLQARALKRRTRSLLRRRLPPLAVLDRLALRSIIVGFPFFTVSLLLGMFQSVKVGGGLRLVYVLALISWLIYGGVLQARLVAGWRGRRAAALTIFGLLVALSVVLQYALGVA